MVTTFLVFAIYGFFIMVTLWFAGVLLTLVISVLSLVWYGISSLYKWLMHDEKA